MTSHIDSKTKSILIDAAKKARLNAYAKYSNFPVGAAVLTENGGIFQGCNVENSSYGLTVCAERNAIFNAVVNGQKKILAVVVFTPTDKPSPPCGACRQVINEFGPDAEVISVCNSQEELADRSSVLLPKAFGPNNL